MATVELESKRAVRQAQELLVKLRKRSKIEEHTTAEVSIASAHSISNNIDATWAIPILIALWTSSLTIDELILIRPSIKLGIAYLVRFGNGNSRSQAGLSDLIWKCFSDLEAEGDELANAWLAANPASKGNNKRFEITGAGFQTTADARGIVDLGIDGAIYSLHMVLSGQLPPESVARFAPHLARVPIEHVGRRIWLGVYLRIRLIFTIGQLHDVGSTLTLLPSCFWGQSYLQIGDSSHTIAFKMEDIAELVEYSVRGYGLSAVSEELVAFPLVRSGEFYATSVPLLLDSIAPYMLAEIHKRGLWETSISSLFEESVISLLHSHGFVAGSVSENGNWNIASSEVRVVAIADKLRNSQKDYGYGNPGQIDVLAYRENAVFLIECKSIFGLRNARNLVSEFSATDAAGWHQKLTMKRRWLEHVLGRKVDLALILMEGAKALDSDTRGKEVILANLELLELLAKTASTGGLPD
jgi:hypothetical protein